MMEGIPYTNQRILILAPHADDETIGCGGAIAKYLRQRSQVRVVIASFTLSVTKRYRKETAGYDSYKGEERWNELEEAMRVLGVTDRHVLFPDRSAKPRYDGRLNLVPRADLVERVERHIEEFRPTVLFIPSITKHQDHEALHQAAIAASRPYFWSGSVLVYETDGELAFQPNLYIPLTADEMLCKMEALRAYQTQVGSILHPVHPESLYHKAKFRGNQIYEEFAEAFQVVRLRG